VVVNDLATKLAMCAAGQGVAQGFELGLAPWLESGQLVQVLADWAEERYRSTPTTHRGICRRRR